MSKRGTIIDGIAASEVMDSSAEKIDISRMDISSLGADDSVFNWEHKSKDSPVQVIGKITFAKKIFKKSDCSNERQEYWWNKIKVPFIYAKGELFDAVGHSGAKDAAAILRYDNRHHGAKSRSLVAWSIEGGTMKRDGINIQDSLARDIAITVKPCNKTAHCEILEDAEEYSLFKTETSFQEINSDDNVESLLKREEVDVEALKKEDSMYPSPKKPAMTKPEARAKFGSVKVLDDKPKSKPGEFGKVTVKDDKPMNSTNQKFGSIKRRDDAGNALPNSEKKNIKAQPPQWDKSLGNSKEKPLSTKPEPKKPAFHETMSATHASHIPEGHADRKSMVAHIGETLKSGNRGEARRLFDRFIAPMKKMEELNKTMTAGSGASAPSQLTGGAALAKECVDEGLQVLSKENPPKKNKKKKPSKKKITLKPIADDKVKDSNSQENSDAQEAAKGIIGVGPKPTRFKKMEEAYRSWGDQQAFVKFFQTRMPHLSKKEVEAITKLVALRHFEKNEKRLSGMMKMESTFKKKDEHGTHYGAKDKGHAEQILGSKGHTNLKHSHDEKTGKCNWHNESGTHVASFKDKNLVVKKIRG